MPWGVCKRKLARLKTRRKLPWDPKILLRFLFVLYRLTVWGSASSCPLQRMINYFLNDHVSIRPLGLENFELGLEFRPSFTLSSLQVTGLLPRKVLFFHAHWHFFHEDELFSWQKIMSPITLSLFLPPQNWHIFKWEKFSKQKYFCNILYRKSKRQYFWHVCH